MDIVEHPFLSSPVLSEESDEVILGDADLAAQPMEGQLPSVDPTANRLRGDPDNVCCLVDCQELGDASRHGGHCGNSVSLVVVEEQSASAAA
jgi:hypothetical protein